MTDEHDANQPQSVSPDTVAHLRRIEYLEWLAANMAADVTAWPRNASKVFQRRTSPATAIAMRTLPAALLMASSYSYRQLWEAVSDEAHPGAQA